MSTNQSSRPRFYEGQFLGAADLTNAVDYGRIEDARHALGAHTWGIASGLQLTDKDSAAGGGQVDVFIQPGYAVDGFGRSIVVPTPFKISGELFKSVLFNAGDDNGTPPGRLFKVWLRYDESATQQAGPGFEVCGAEGQFSRTGETFRIEIGERPNHSSHAPVSVAGYSLDAQEVWQKFDPQNPAVAVFDESIPFQEFPINNPTTRWLIPLGAVRWLANSNTSQAGHFVKREPADLVHSKSLRRYIGVVAGSVEAADGVVRLHNRTKPYSTVPPLDLDDVVWVEGNMRVLGDARIFGKTLDFRDQNGIRNANIPLFIQRSDVAGTSSRLEAVIGEDNQGHNSFAVGPIDKSNPAQPKFVPKLSVRDDGKVGMGTTTPDRLLTIAGNGGTYLNIKDGTTHEVLLGVDGNGGIVSTMTNHDLVLRTNNLTRMSIKADGRVGIGTNTPVSSLQVVGDLTLEQLAAGAPRVLPPGATMCWNDNRWLRLNQNLDFSKPIFGVHTPGLFAPGSLNVGGADAWGDPGFGNVWILRNTGMGTTTPFTRLTLDGSIGFKSGPLPMMYIFESGTENPERPIFAHSPTFPNWGLTYRDIGDRMIFQRDGTAVVTVDLGTRELIVAGNAFKPGGGSWGDSSDLRLKKDVEPLTEALNKLLQLRGVSFQWKEPEKMGNLKGKQTGFVAQEVEPVFPDWISTRTDGVKQMTIRGFEALTVEAFREIKNELESIKERLQKLESSEPESAKSSKKKPAPGQKSST